MMRTFACYTVLLGVWVTLLNLAPQSAGAQSPLPPATANGVNDYVLVPSAQLAFDDKSRIGSGLTGVGDSHDRPLKDLYPPIKLLLGVAGNYYVGRAHLYSTSLLLSDTTRSLDLGIQPFVGDSEGYGIRLRFDPAREKLASALSALYTELEKPTNEPNHARKVANALTTARQEAEENAIGDTDKMRLKVRYSAILGFQHIRDDLRAQSGSYGDVGAVVSVLIPLDYDALHKPQEDKGQRRSPGVTLLLATQLIQVYPDNVSTLNQATLLRYGLAVVWQDKVPSRYARLQSDGQLLAGINRWKWQAGASYLPKNGIDSGRAVNAFVRCRVTSFTELTVNGGFDSDGIGYAGVGLATSFDLSHR